jgi:hypothetical protein
VPLAEFIRNSWTVDYDERMAVDLSSDKPLGDIVKRFSWMLYEFVKARVRFVKQAQSAADRTCSAACARPSHPARSRGSWAMSLTASRSQ